MITPVMTASAQSKVTAWTHKIRENSIALATLQKRKRPQPELEAYPVQQTQEKANKRLKRDKLREKVLIPFMDLTGDKPQPFPKDSPRASQMINAAKAYPYWKRTLKSRLSDAQIKSLFLKTYKDYAGIQDVVK